MYHDTYTLTQVLLIAGALVAMTGLIIWSYEDEVKCFKRELDRARNTEHRLGFKLNQANRTIDRLQQRLEHSDETLDLYADTPLPFNVVDIRKDVAS